MKVEHAAVSRSKRIPSEAPSSGKRKVMLYVPPELHRAMRQLALDEGRSASDVYGEAARAFLGSRGVEIAATPEPEPASRASDVADLAGAIERQGRRIEELHAVIADVRGAVPRGGQAPAGTKAAEAMKVVLGIMKAAGPAGIASRELGTAVQATKVNPGAAETAKAVLRAAGLVQCEGKRWYVDGD